MSGRRLYLAHTVAEDRGSESGAPTLSRGGGQLVSGFATFYIATTGAWEKIPPGRLDLSELLGGASGIGSNEAACLRAAITAITLNVPGVEFYLGQNPARIDSFVALNATTQDIFTFGFFGRRYS